MSINYCTISNSSVDSFCGNRRAIVLDRLIRELRPPVPTVNSAGNSAYVRTPIPQIPRRREDERWEPPTVAPTELDRIVVSVNFNGITGVAEQEVDGRLDLVYVTELKVEHVEVSVNISALKFNE